MRTAVSADWFDWPTLPDLFPVSFPGVQTKRDSFLIDVDFGRLKERVAEYFDSDLSHEEIARRYPISMKSSSGFVVRDARIVRNALLSRGGPNEGGFVRFAYRPFDDRWLYWDAGRGLLGRPSLEYWSHAFQGNLFIEARERDTKEAFSRGTLVRTLADNFGNGFSSFFPMQLRGSGIGNDDAGAHCPNLSGTAQRYLDRLGLGVEDLFHHVLATLHDPAYREDNAGALRMEWPRIPLPGWPEGGAYGAVEAISVSAAHGRELAALFDTDTPVPGVTQAPLRPKIAAIAVPATVNGRNMAGDDFAVTAGWGHYGQGDAVMPGQGRSAKRAFSPTERAALNDASSVLGERTFDIYLNDGAFWRNVPETVWNYRLGGYQVLKKWLSYRERPILGRPLKPKEVRHFSDMARRIQGIILSMSQDLST